MPNDASERMEKNAERLLLGDSHPVLALVAFAVFLFAALPFLLDTDKWVVVPA